MDRQASGYEQALEYIRPGGVVVAVSVGKASDLSAVRELKITIQVGLPPGAVIKSEVFTHASTSSCTILAFLS